MKKAISLDLRERIVAAYEGKEGTREEVAKRFKVSVGMVKKLMAQRNRTGDLRPRYRYCGRKARLEPEHGERMRKLVGQEPDVMPGPIIEDPAALIDEYVQHRAARDEQILSAIAAAPRTPRQIADAVYRGLAAALKDAAAETVLAHLIKLRGEGRAHEDGGKWMRVG